MAKAPQNPFFDMFQKFGENMNIPKPDLTSMMEMHRKNLEALQAAAEINSKSAQALMDKQRAALEDALKDISDAVQDVAKNDDTSAMMNSQMDLAKKSFDATLRNSADMAEIVKQGNMDAYSVLRDRVMNNIDEMSAKSSKKSK